MSVTMMAAVFARSRAKGAARLVLLALADVAADTGQVTAYARSQSHIAAKANVDTKTVRDAIAKLVELGELEVITVGDGRRQSDYLITIPETRAGESPPLASPPEGGSIAPPGRVPPPPQAGPTTPPIIPSSTSSTTANPRAGKPAKGSGTRRYSDEAQRLAVAEWERKPAKPVCGFVGLRARIDEVLAAGYSSDAVARVLPTMSVYSRNAFDLALASTRNGGRPGRPVDTDRDGPSGRLELDHG